MGSISGGQAQYGAEIRAALSETTIDLSSEEAPVLLDLLDRDPTAKITTSELSLLGIRAATVVLKEVQERGTGPFAVERELPLVAVWRMVLSIRLLTLDFEEDCEAGLYPEGWPYKGFTMGRLRALDCRLTKIINATYGRRLEQYEAEERRAPGRVAIPSVNR